MFFVPKGHINTHTQWQSSRHDKVGWRWWWFITLVQKLEQSVVEKEKLSRVLHSHSQLIKKKCVFLYSNDLDTLKWGVMWDLPRAVRTLGRWQSRIHTHAHSFILISDAVDEVTAKNKTKKNTASFSKNFKCCTVCRNAMSSNSTVLIPQSPRCLFCCSDSERSVTVE